MGLDSPEPGCVSALGQPSKMGPWRFVSMVEWEANCAHCLWVLTHRQSVAAGRSAARLAVVCGPISDAAALVLAEAQQLEAWLRACQRQTDGRAACQSERIRGWGHALGL